MLNAGRPAGEAYYDDQNTLGSRLRRRRLAMFLEMIAAVSGRHGRCRILDLGGRRSYWRAAPPGFLQAHRCTVTLSNLEDQPDGDDIFSTIREDACALAYPDASFDLVHSNSVIEHVGGWARMRSFADQTRRVAPGYFIQTPDYWFPYEPHYGTPFFALMPRPLQLRLLMSRPCGFFPKAKSLDEAIRCLEATQLLTRRMMAELFPDAEIVHERVGGLSKSLIAVRRPEP